jgi:cell fate regulator YaaT (PSP1 superfamily)
MSCLAYEVKENERLRKTMPEYGSRVTTPRGDAKVIGLDVLNQNLKVYLDSGGVQFFTVAEITKGAAPKPEKPFRINSKK